MTDPAPPRSGDRVIVIGGGATGALIAWLLTMCGFSVTVFEKKSIGNGASSRSAACIRAQWKTLETIIGMMFSEDFFLHFNQILEVPEEDRSWMIRQNGYLWLYENPGEYFDPALYGSARDSWSQAQINVKTQQSVGLPVELLSPDEVHRRWPHINPDRLIGATWCNTDGFLNHDPVYLQGFATARRHGATLKQNTEVLSGVSRGGKLVGVHTTAGYFEADWFVNAANIWGPRLSRRLDGMDLPVSPEKRYLYYLSPGTPTFKEVWPDLPMTIYGFGAGRGSYSRPFDHQLMMGWAHVVEPDHDFVDEDQERFDPGYRHTDNSMGNFGTALLEQINDFAPTLAGCGQIKTSTSGYYDTTPDHNPIIGADLKRPNLIHAVGFSGHGLMHAPITAVLVAALIKGETVDGRVRLPEPFQDHVISLDTFRPDRVFKDKETQAL